MRRICIYIAGLSLAALFLGVFSTFAGEVIVLTQTACQFVEAEGADHHFNSKSADACRSINEASQDKRLKQAQTLYLKAGDYVFRVKNRDVPYELGFWLRGAGISRWTLPGISGGGIATGDVHDYTISLEPGEYRYSCPLNPTPDYVLIVE
ncbi:MAG: hypothetical protein Q9M12_04750 [Mariprofundus sp.]|nr:hypothetical protein [Mariprofundus sp.]